MDTETPSPTSTTRLPQVPLTIHQIEAFFQPPNETRPPSKCSLPSYGRSIHDPSTVTTAFEAGYLTQDLSPVFGAQVSTGSPASPVDNNGKRRGPPNVQWDASKDRKYARLYSLTDVNIDDLPIIMKDSKLKFEKRIAQEKAAENLGPRPNELRPSADEPKDMHERIKQSYLSKQYLEKRNQGKLPKLPKIPYSFQEATSSNLEALENQLEEEFAAGKRVSPGKSSHLFVEALDNFAQEIVDEPEQTTTVPGMERKIRTSYESLQSLRRRLNERIAKKGQREYSYNELVQYIFIKRLSVGSIPSSRSITSSFLSKRTSDASELFSFTSKRQSLRSLSSIRGEEVSESSAIPPPGRLNSGTDQIYSTPHTATSKREPRSNLVTTDAVDGMFKVHGFPHIGPHPILLNPPKIISHVDPGNYINLTSLGHFDPDHATPNRRHGRNCCLDLCRGDPRADKCLICLYEAPPTHVVVRSLIEQWTSEKEILAKLDLVTIAFDEVDDFGDTLLHIASSLGAASRILSWFISMGVNVHAKNAAGQTFMHVLNPMPFRHHHRRDTLAAAISTVTDILQKMKFDFTARDDFGRTVMHALSQYSISTDILQLAFEGGLTGGASILNVDFLGASVESQIRTHVSASQQQASAANDLRHVARPSTTGPHQPFNKTAPPLGNILWENAMSVSQLNASPVSLRKAITQATLGFPETRYQGRNSLHCLAECCSSLQLGANDTNTNMSLLKRKRQTDLTLRHEYIVNTAKKLLQAGVDVNDYDNRGYTPLMSFICNDLSPTPERKITAEVLQLLIDAGASVHRRNRKGETALHIAMRLGRPAAVEVLLNNHANVHTRAEKGEGALAVASKAFLRAKRDGALYHRIITCMAIATKYGAILGPSTKDEWDRQRKCVNKEGPVMIGPGNDEVPYVLVQ